ncbi:hypothetical protein [Hymenobacter cellulosivorans]|uniref:Uncharacterized protein n=1 Tax=Hymenobacter cellulosivorans TaxID=2932249 RepID=A0ABY4FBN6_9BACT|nr:hypothetical protein [Hymenobacter cellulosivorans]UOQ53402.1 hypothetical protein MUN80_01275 [Hymenobacter cellulosivorans]
MTASFRFATLVLLVTACRPDTPATEQATSPTVPTPAPSTPPPSAKAGPTDTLHLPGGQLVQLHPVSTATFAQLPTSKLPEMLNDSTAEHLETTQGQVRRQGLDLLLQPAQGKVVKLSSTPEAEFTLQNGEAVRYQYWGSLPAAHQWVVRAWYWEASGTVLVDQRTGRSVELIGDPVASPDGKLVLLTSPGLSGGDQANALGLVQIGADGPHQLWQREPTTWEPAEARWSSSNQVVLQLRHPDAEGIIAEDAPVTYAELTLPVAH